MRPSSTDPAAAPAGAGATDPRTRAPQAERSATTDGPVVRAVNFDRPLHGGATTLSWADPTIEGRIADAASQAREQAHSLGYAAGWAQGRRAAAAREATERAERAAAADRALQEERRQLQTLVQTLSEAARRLALDTVPAWNEVADAIADGALAITRAALGRELAAVDAEVADAVRTALHTLATDDELTVHLHPGDLARVQDLLGDELPERARLTADPAVCPGGVLATTAVQRLRRDLPTAIARAEEVLRS